MTAIPANTAVFSAREIAEICAGTLHGANVQVRGVCTDSRQDVAGKLFVALTGENFDGHRFAAATAQAGAALLLVEQDLPRLPVPVVRVKSTLTALGELARVHRQRWGKRLVAVAGSAGKTTTRATVTAALQILAPGAGRVHATRGNLNNRIGVPMTLLGLEAQHELAVIEVGTNEPGEVAALTRIVAPDVAILTLIGEEHMAGLGDLDGVEAEEAALFTALPAHAVAIGNWDDERVRRRLCAAPVTRRVGYGTHPDSQMRLVAREMRGAQGQDLQIAYPGARAPLELPCALLGAGPAHAVLAALSAFWALGGDFEQHAALQGAFAAEDLAEKGRLRPILLADGSLLLDDTYNSNPPSVRSSVQAARELAQARNSRLLLVLGEMRELGPTSARQHYELGAELARGEADYVLGVVGDAEQLVLGFQTAEQGIAEFAPNLERALACLTAKVAPGDVILVKASRGVRAENIVSGLSAGIGTLA